MQSIFFPKGFTWGVAASAHQIEGAWDQDGKGPSIWDTFNHTRGKIANGETGDVAIDHYHRYKEDAALMGQLGIPAYRFSIAWSRILPEGKGKVNPKGLGFYDRLVDELLKNKVEPYACLFHYDLPQALQGEGGWPKRDVAYYFADYARIVSERLSDRVGTFLTHNEPWVPAIVGYIAGEHAPGLRRPAAGFKALHHLLLSHGLASQAIRAAGRRPVKVGIVLNLSPIHPARDIKADREAARRMDTLLNRVVLDPLLKGTSPLQESAASKLITSGLIQPGDLETIRTLDLLGINYYTRTVARYDPKFPIVAASQVQPEGNEYSGMWEIYPEGLYEIILRVWNDYFQPSPPSPLPLGEGSKLPELMVTENGVPVPDGLDFDGRVRDERRIRYLKNHIFQVHRAIKAGVPIQGYFVWSFMDNFEWALGYGPRFGLVYVDFKTLKRTVKDSGSWFAQVIKDNGFEI
jgi:beta-glucosidase